MTPETAVKALAGLRFAVGASAYTAPRLAGKTFGLDIDGNPQAPYLARLFAARDVGLGVGMLNSTGAARRNWLAIGIGCDAADAVAAILAKRDGSMSGVTAAMCFAPAISAVVLGAIAHAAAGEEPIGPAPAVA